MLSKSKLVVWKKSNDEFYYKLVSTFGRSEVGYENCYGHKIVYVIDLTEIIKKPKVRKKVIKRLIRFLQNIDKKL